MIHWLKLRPILVMGLLLVTPTAALAHLVLTWAPGEFVVRRLISSIEDGDRLVRQQLEELERLRAEMDRLQELAAVRPGQPRPGSVSDDFSEGGWLPQRLHHLVSARLAGAFESPHRPDARANSGENRQDAGSTLTGVYELPVHTLRLERLAFDEPALYAAAPRAGVLACEQVTLTCRGSYADLVAALDRLATLGLPIRVTCMSWRRGRTRGLSQAADGQRGGRPLHHLQQAEPDVELTLQMQIPFAPDAGLAAALREIAGWEEEDEL